MEQKPVNAARLLTYSGDRPGRDSKGEEYDSDDPEWDDEEYDYYEFVGRWLEIEGIPLINTSRFSDFELLITTGHYDAAIVHYPESKGRLRLENYRRQRHERHDLLEGPK